MYNIANTLQISAMFTQPTPPTPRDTPINRSINWSKLTYPPRPPTTQTPNIPLIIDIDKCLPLKYIPQSFYYTDGSFKPPKEASQGHWKHEKTRYGIYNSIKKNLKITIRLPRLQNILRAEMMAIHHTLQLLTTIYPDEPTHIFMDCLNVLYLLNTQIKHPTIHNSHPYKNILESMTTMLQSRTQITTLHKVKARANINGNEQVDTLAKLGCGLDHRDAAMPHEHAHPTPYYLQKDWWHSMQETPDKGPIRHLGKYVLKYDKNHNLEVIANQTHQLHKWLENKDIDKTLSNNFWKNPSIMDKQNNMLNQNPNGTVYGPRPQATLLG